VHVCARVFAYVYINVYVCMPNGDASTHVCRPATTVWRRR
jgi:hypothetical protein